MSLIDSFFLRKILTHTKHHEYIHLSITEDEYITTKLMVHDDTVKPICMSLMDLSDVSSCSPKFGLFILEFFNELGVCGLIRLPKNLEL